MQAPTFVAGSEAARYSLLYRLLSWPAFHGLFSRVAGPALLQQRTRDLIYQSIQARPGGYYRALLRELALSTGALTYHLYRLERAGLIRRQRHGLKVRFFPMQLGVPKSAALHALQYRLLSEVRSEAGVTQSEVARRLQVSRQALHYHLDWLRKSGLIVVTQAGRETHLRVSPEAWSRIGTCPRCATPFVARSTDDLRIRCPACSAEIQRAS